MIDAAELKAMRMRREAALQVARSEVWVSMWTAKHTWETVLADELRLIEEVERVTRSKMGKDSAIEWTDHTWNIGWGCVEKSPGCANCYARRLALRYGFDVWGKNKPRRYLSEDNWKAPLHWQKSAADREVRERVFCGSMMDWTDQEWEILLPRLWQLWCDTPNLDWLMLTKNADRLWRSLPSDWATGWITHYGNVWLGVSVENQRFADLRIPQLLSVPAAVNFLSCEPLLGEVTITPYLTPNPSPIKRGEERVNWVICGGESGPGARPMKPDWVSRLRDQCVMAGVPFFFKQWGGVNKKAAGRMLDGREWNDIPARENDGVNCCA